MGYLEGWVIEVLVIVDKASMAFFNNSGFIAFL